MNRANLHKFNQIAKVDRLNREFTFGRFAVSFLLKMNNQILPVAWRRWVAGLLVGFIPLLFNHCQTAQRSQQNRAFLYKQRVVASPLQAKAHHLSDDSTEVYVTVSPDFFTASTSSEWLVNYQWYDNEQAGVPIDTVIATIRPTLQPAEPVLIRQGFRLTAGRTYWLHVFVLDKTSNKVAKQQWRMAKPVGGGRDSYLLTDLQNQPLPDNYLRQGATVNVYRQLNVSETWSVRYYRPIQQLARPPFVENPPLPYPTVADSSFQTSNPIHFSKAGTYILQPFDRLEPVFTVTVVDADFPKLTAAADLLELLRYITKNEEFYALQHTAHAKATIDSFWLAKAGSAERGKELIKEFYGRVQRANELFTTFKEGWKTDQGLLYIIYGEPDVVVQKRDFEQWIYERTHEQEALSFVFLQQTTPFGSSYFLSRSPVYENSWHLSVYEWRKGIIRNKSE